MISRQLFNGLVVLVTLEAAGLVFVKVATAEAYLAEFGDVQAELSYSCKEPGEYGECRKNRSHLTIIRDGKTLLQTKFADEERPVVTYDLSASGGFQVQDLDGDREPEVMVNTSTGGAHCCTISSVYRYSSSQNQYTETSRDWQQSGYRLQDLDNGRHSPNFSVEMTALSIGSLATLRRVVPFRFGSIARVNLLT